MVVEFLWFVGSRATIFFFDVVLEVYARGFDWWWFVWFVIIDLIIVNLVLEVV